MKFDICKIIDLKNHKRSHEINEIGEIYQFGKTKEHIYKCINCNHIIYFTETEEFGLDYNILHTTDKIINGISLPKNYFSFEEFDNDLLSCEYQMVENLNNKNINNAKN